MNEIISSIGPALTFIVGIASCWFTFVIVNVIVTMFNAKKLDNSLTFCFNKLGKIFYLAMTLLYVATIIGSIYYTPHILSSYLPHSAKISILSHLQPPSKSYFNYILVGELTIITPIYYA